MKKIFLIIILLLTTASLIYGADKNKKKDESIFYTYLGPYVEGGYNIVSINKWNSTTSTYVEGQMTYGPHVNGGLQFAIFTKYVAGDFRLSFNYNFFDSGDVFHLKGSLTAKALFKMNKIFYLTVGPGFYFETQPSNLDYLGAAGVQLPLGMVIETSESTRFVIDLMSRFGYYGIGESSYKLSFGLTIGFLMRVGKI